MWEKLKEAGNCKKYVFAFIFRLFRKIAKGDYWLCHVCPPGTARLPLDGFSWNLVFEYFSKICQGNSFLSLTSVNDTLREDQ